MANYRKKSSHTYGKRKQKSFAWVWLLTGMILGIVSVVYTYPLLQNRFSFDALKRFNVARGAASQDAGVTVEKVIIKKKKPETQQYEFYTMLPDMEVALPKEKPSSTNPPIVQAKPEPIPVIIQAEEKSNPRTSYPPKGGTKQIVKQDNVSTAIHSQSVVNHKALKHHKTGVANKMVKPTPVNLCKTQVVEYLVQAGMYRSAREADGLKARLALLGCNARLQKIDAENGLWFRVIIGPFPSESMALVQQKKLAMQNIKGILVMQRKVK